MSAFDTIKKMMKKETDKPVYASEGERKIAKLTEMLKLADNQITPELLKELFDALMQKFISLQSEMKNDTNQSKNQLMERMGASMNDMRQLAKELETSIEKKTKELENQRKALKSEFQDEMTLLSQMMEKLPDTEKVKTEYTRLERVVSMLPLEVKREVEKMMFEHIEIRKELKTLKDMLKTSKGGGGVTNARIIQSFKYILKTETPVGDIDGANTDYTVSQPIFAVLAFSLNGEVIPQIPNYTIAGKTITFSSALPAVYSGKDFEIKYI